MAWRASKFIPLVAGLVVTMYYVYILYSPAVKKYYTGQSKYRGKRRREHIRENKHWTRCADDWEEVFCEAVGTRDQARDLEIKIKKRGAKRFLVEKAEKQA